MGGKLLAGSAISTFLRTGDRTLVATELGQVDVLQDLPQVPPFASLEEQAKDVDLDGLVVRVCSLEHLIEMKRSSERARDREDLAALEAVQDEEREGNDSPRRYPVATRSPWSGRFWAASCLPRWKPSPPNNRPCRLRPARPTPLSRWCRGARRCARRSRPGGRRSGSKTSSSSPGCSSPASSTSRTRCCEAVITFVAFCLISSAGYFVNDLIDVELDRKHPKKRFRPLAAGELSEGTAKAIAPVLAVDRDRDRLRPSTGRSG